MTRWSKSTARSRSGGGNSSLSPSVAVFLTSFSTPRLSCDVGREMVEDRSRHSRRSTFADEILAVMNLSVTEPFIQVVQLTNRKVPTVILYDPRQLHEIRSFCFDARRGSILSFDKTYNLGSLFVTVSTYMNMALRRLNTGDSPVFIGPLFLHGNSDASTYHSFFGHLRGCFGDKPLDQLRIGSDDEMAIRKSMSLFFKQVTCTRHLKVRKEPTAILFSSFIL